MITSKQIQKWKKQNQEVWMVTILDQEFYYRPITRDEYEDIMMQDTDLAEFQELACRVAVLHPIGFDYSHGKAGYAELLCNLILNAAGLHQGQPEQLLNEQRESMAIFDNQVECMIHEAFPEFRMEEIRQWTVHKTMWYAARAEFILIQLRGRPIIPMDQIQKEQQSPQQPQRPPYSSPQERAENHPAARPPDPQEPQEPRQRQASGEKVELSEEETMRMLQKAMASHPSGGQRVDPSRENNPTDMFPELSWFKGEEELRGEYD